MFSNYDYRRGKGNRQSRLGPRMQISTLENKKAANTPNTLALKKLKKSLKAIGLPEFEVQKYYNIMQDAEQLRFMNMPILAQVFKYRYDNNNNDDAIDANFTADNMKPYIDYLIPPADINDNIIRMRFLATMFRYNRYVIFVMANAPVSPPTE